MVDLGIYNFVKNSIAQGKSKEEIDNDLIKSGLSQADIDEAYIAVEQNDVPRPAEEYEKTFNSGNIKLENQIKSERPLLITIACAGYLILVAATLLVYLFLFFRFGSHSIFSVYAKPESIFDLGMFVAIFGYWKMRKWGVYLLTTSFILSVMYMIFVGLILQSTLLNPYHIFINSVIPIAVAIVGFKYLNRMS